MKKILVACGTSEHKKEFAVETIQKYCDSHNIEAEVKGENVYEVDIDKEKPDVIVLIGPNKFNTNIPIVMGTPFITKMGMESACQQIVSHLK